MSLTSVFDARRDIPAALVVFLVALPLCLGIALASDAPLMSGIVAGVIGGVVVGYLSGSHTAVSGPAAGLAVIVATGVHELGGFQFFLVALVLAGLLQIAFGLARIGWMASLFPSSVVRGMLAAIGIIVILKQIPHALGRDHDYEGDESFWLASGADNTFTELLKSVMTMQPGVVVVSVISLLLIVGWDHPAIKRHGWTRVIPAPLLAVIAGVVLNAVYAAVAPHLLILAADGHLVQIPSMSNGIGQVLTSPDWSVIGNPDVWMVAVEIAAVASLETLLSLEATDRIDPARRRTPADRELLAQGFGNTLSGLIGGLPITAVIVRSSANIQAGAASRWSAVLHGTLLAALVLAAPGLLNLIPLGSLAAILLVTGYRLARVQTFHEMYARGFAQFGPFMVTIVTTVLTDLLTGVAVGLVFGIIATVLTDHHTAVTVVQEDQEWLVRFTRDVSFLNKHALRKILEQIPEGADVVIDGSRAAFVDPDIADLLIEFQQQSQWKNMRVTMRSLEGKFQLAQSAAH